MYFVIGLYDSYGIYQDSEAVFCISFGAHNSFELVDMLLTSIDEQNCQGYNDWSDGESLLEVYMGLDFHDSA